MKIIDKLDNSMMMEYASCPRKFYYRYALNLTSKDDSALFKPEFGSALHSALEAHYLGYNVELAKAAFTKHWMPYEGKDVKGIRTLLKGLKIVESYVENLLHVSNMTSNKLLTARVHILTFVFILYTLIPIFIHFHDSFAFHLDEHHILFSILRLGFSIFS